MSKLTSQELDSSKLAASTTKSGLVQLNNTINSTSTTQAATANAVKTAYDLANHSHPYAATSHTHTASDLPTASTTVSGLVQLNNTINSTSTTQAATANAVKTAYDLANHTHPYLPTGSNGTTTGKLTVNRNATGSISTASALDQFEIVSSNSGSCSGISFHRSGIYAVNFGLDTDNKLKVGGWSMGTNSYEILHKGNESSINAGSVGGYTAAQLMSAGAPIKNIQRGAAVLANSSSLNVTISAVNLSKSFLNIVSWHVGSVAGSTRIYGRLASTTTISFDKTSSTDSGTAYWEVIEFN